MISVHMGGIFTINNVYAYILYHNTVIFFLTLFYFILMLIVILANNIQWAVFSIKANFILKQIYFSVLAGSFFLILIKFIGFTEVLKSVSLTTKYTEFIGNYSGSLLGVNLLGDILVLLVIITTFISYVYLSERYLSLSMGNLFYFFVFIIFTMNMVYATNLLVMFIFFEFIFLPSMYFVYWLSYSKRSDKAIKYLLVWTLTGSFCVVFSLTYMYSIVGTLNIQDIYLIQFSTLEKNFLFIGFFIGFGVKLPLWPFHYWLTKVHVEAPTGFSIFLSGYLVKTALYCVIYFCFLFKSQTMLYFVLSVIFIGAVDASIRMWSATDIKRLIAFATIQEMNLIVGFFFLLDNSYMQILNIFILIHGVLSTLLFFLVDQIQKRYQTRNLVAISGLAYKLPNLHLIIWVSILVFRGFPIFIKFFIEWELLNILIYNFNFWGFILFLLVSVYGVLGFCRIWLSVLYGVPSKNLITSTDILYKDFIVAIYLLLLLTILSSLIFLFNGCSFPDNFT